MGDTAGKELKARLIAEMSEARAVMAHHAGVVSVEYTPTAILRRSFQRHKAAWMVGAAVAGLVALRLVFPSREAKNSRDKSGKPATKGAISGFLAGSLAAAARKAALSYAQKQVQHFIHNQLSPSVKADGQQQSPHSHV
jgi:hypothetical protein